MLDEVTALLGALSPARRSLLFVAVPLSLCTLFFSNILFTDGVLISDNLDRYYPWNYYATGETEQAALNGIWDRVLEECPQRLIAARIVKSGELPLWNPHYLGGFPLLATDPGRGFLYPFNAIFYVIDPLKALGYASLVQLFLGATFMYFYLRTIELPEAASLFGAIVFGLGGYFLPYLSWLARVNTAIWMPLMFLCVEKLFRGRGWIWAIVLGFAVAMACMAGHFGVVAYEALAVGLYLAWRLLPTLKSRGMAKPVRLVLYVAAGVILGALLAAVQLLPTFDALRFIERAQRPYEDRLDRGRAPYVLAMALVPDIFGNPVDPPPWGRHRFGENIPGYYAPSSTYAGVLPLILAMWVLLVKRARFALFFAFLAAVSISIFLDTVVFRLLYFLPIFRFGRQEEAKIIYMFAISVLAGLGLNSLLNRTEEVGNMVLRRSSLALSVVAGVTVTSLGLGGILVCSRGAENLGLPGAWYVYNVGNILRFAVLVYSCSFLLWLLSRGSLKPSQFGLLAALLVVADLFYFGWRFNPPQDPRNLYQETEGIRFLRSDQGIFRIMRGPMGGHTLPPDTPAVFNLSDAGGYRALPLEYYGEFMNLIEDGLWDVDSVRVRTIRSLTRAESVSSKLLDLLNVKYILSNPEGREDLTAFVESDKNTVLAYQGDMKIYENKNVLPRAFVVTGYKVLQDREQIFSELTSEEFDPASCVILEEEPEPHFVSTLAPLREASINIVEYSSSRVTVQVETPRDVFLVLSDLYYEGWKAFVDGQSQKLYKADYVFRAVQLTRGQHTVEFVFDPLSFKVGLGVSAITLVPVSASLVTHRLARKST